MNPCSDSMILGRYTRLVSPWPSLPAGGESRKRARTFFYEKSREGEKKQLCRLLFSEEVVSRPLSPPPKDHTVRPSCATAMVWELPQATCPTPLISFTRVGTLRLWLSLWPDPRTKKNVSRESHNSQNDRGSTFLRNQTCTETAEVPFAPRVELPVVGHSSAVSVTSRHANHNLER